VAYKDLGMDLMKKNQFIPSFSSQINNFKSLVRCGACACFEKATAHGLCKLCYFYAQHGMHQHLIKQQYTLPNPVTTVELDDCLGSLVRSVFGFESLQLNQRDAIAAYVSGEDTFLIMPTGSGKSLCFWTAAILRPGLTVVLEPLIALMQDQVVSNDFKLNSIQGNLLFSLNDRPN
jgi:superfamily II DNA helicase RecQ